MSEQPRASTVREGQMYRGVIREGGRTIWTCEHLHRSPGIRQSARDCAAQHLRERMAADAR